MRMKTQRILAALLSLILLLALAPAGWAEGGEGGGGSGGEGGTGSGKVTIPEFLSNPNTVVINLTPGSDEEFNKEIVNASVQADLYLITKAKPVEGYDTYEYEKLTGAFADEKLQKKLNDALKTDPLNKPEEIENQAARKDTMLRKLTPLAYDFAEIILNGDYTAVQSVPAAEGASTITVSNLEAGLYLLVLRGSNLTEKKNLMLPADAEPEDQKDYGYVTETEKKLSDYGPGVTDETETAEKHLATRAFSDKYEFLFEPQLITVPTRVDKDDSTALQYNTAFGVWSNELDINIKAAKKDRTGKIKVKKTLSDYLDLGKDETFEPALFTFEVVATKTKERDSEVLYRKQVSINIEGPDDVGKTKLLKDLPVGSFAWITEIYQGAHYKLNTSANTGPIEVKADKVVVVDGTTALEEQENITATFDNVNNDTHRGGHGIENRFTFNEKTGDWDLTPTGGDRATIGREVEER